jgi:hypothetical protein
MPGLDAFQLTDIMVRLTHRDMVIPTEGDDLADFQQFVASGEAMSRPVATTSSSNPWHDAPVVVTNSHMQPVSCCLLLAGWGCAPDTVLGRFSVGHAQPEQPLAGTGLPKRPSTCTWSAAGCLARVLLLCCAVYGWMLERISRFKGQQVANAILAIGKLNLYNAELVDALLQVGYPLDQQHMHCLRVL